MEAIEPVASELDFTPLHRRMQWYIDQGTLPGLSTLTMRGVDVVDFKCYGASDVESARPLEPDAIFRIHSNTKLITSVAAMMLFEEGKFRLDDPIATYLPELSELTVLKPGATRPDDLEPVRDQVTIRHLMTHTSGLSYGFMYPDSLIDQIYVGARVFETVFFRRGSLEQLVHMLSRLPLAFQPGTAWRYSLATDVIARLIEVLSHQPFERFLQQRIFEPLGMQDTAFFIPEAKRHRLTPLYIGKQGQRAPVDVSGGSVYFDPSALPSGGGGLASTISDYATFIRMLVSGGVWNGTRFLRPETIELMRTSRVPEHMLIASPQWQMQNTTFGLGFAVKLAPSSGEPQSAAGEFHWGGMAGTHWWVSPNANLAGMCMCQQMETFWHPYSHDFKRIAYEIAGNSGR